MIHFLLLFLRWDGALMSPGCGGIMSQNYGKYQKCFERSVKHIFEHFLGDPSIHSVVESQRARKNHSVWVEVDGSFNGEVHLCFPESTMKEITAKPANRPNRSSMMLRASSAI